MAYSLLPRAPFQTSGFPAKLLPISQIPIFKFFSTNRKPQSFDLPNSFQDIDYRQKILFANLFQRYGFPSSVLHDFIAKNKSLLNSNVSDLEQSLGLLLLTFKLQQNSIVSLVSECPSVLELKFLKKWEVGVASLGSFGKFPSVVKSVLEISKRLRIEPDRFSGCVEDLQGLGFSDRTIGRVLEEFPEIVMMFEREIMEKVDFWTLLGLERYVIDNIFYSVPEVLGYGVTSRLKPLLNEFLDLGFEKSMVIKQIVLDPKILSLEVGELRWYMELLRNLKCRETTKEKIFRKGEFKAGFAAKRAVDCLCGYGLIRKDALSILKREPRVMIYDVADIETKVDFLLERMNFGVDSLVEVPHYLGIKFQKQIVPRYSVIEYLRSKGGLGFEPSLKDIIKPTRLKFYNFYVKPYPECEKLYGRYNTYVETKSRHPVGLWKSFKPVEHLLSPDDLKNLRAVTEYKV